MKKILSVALSTAMAFSMFASVAFGDTAVTPQQQFDALKAKGIFTGYPDGSAGLDKEMTRAEFAKVITKLLGLKEITGTLSYTDKNYTAKNWAVPYIEAVTAAGIMEGKNVEKKIFDFNGKVTVAEMATILTRALDLEIPTETNNNAAAWAKGYVQAAINAGLIDANANFSGNASRELLVGAAYSIDQAQSLKVESYTVTEAGKVVEFKISDGETVKVTLDKALEANKETEVKFTYKDKEFTEKVTYVVTAATKVESATASNYKELIVKFDGEVDQKSAETEENYKVNNSISFSKATLSADKRTVTLRIADGNTTLPKQEEAELKISNVKNSDATKTFSDTVKFTAVDTQIPTTSEVKGLGTKAIRVQFSEPVTALSASNIANYKIDGTPISGYVTFSYPNVAVITTNVAVGDHKLTVSNVEDFAGFKTVPTESTFAVSEDTTAPEIVSSVANDLDEVVITFSEPVKAVAKAYHTSSGRTASEIKISDNTVTLKFSTEANKLSSGVNTVYLEGVKDYSDNSADRQATVTPILDTVRPVVNTVKSEVTGNLTKLTVEFSKAVNSSDAKNKDNYTLRKSDGALYKGTGFSSEGHPVGALDFVSGKDNQITFNTLGDKLPSGTYTLDVSGIRDTRTVANAMAPQSISFTVSAVGDVALNSSWSDVYNTDYTRIYVNFNKAVATSGTGNALDVNKYSYVATVGGTTTYHSFPSTATVSQFDANTVYITVKTSDLTNYSAATSKAIRVSNVADANGNFITNGSEKTIADRSVSTVALKEVKAISSKKISVEFVGTVSLIEDNDFVFFNNNTQITSSFSKSNQTVNSDGNTVVEFTFSTDDVLGAGDKLTYTTQATADINTKDSYGRKLSEVLSQTAVVDGVVPTVKTITASAVDVDVVKVEFDEEVTIYNNPAAFVVYYDGQSAKVTKADIVGGTNGRSTQWELTIDKTLVAGKNLDIALTNGSGKIVVDEAGNAVADFSKNITVGN
ncbi:S-layer homology domain-containing protein [Paenibacillus xylanexedens]|uniref:S-layer homology domain-containing protein n=1 Tax=Paenibacillus xylanexedens TaxID=528191 RepID=UPI003D05B8F5